MGAPQARQGVTEETITLEFVASPLLIGKAAAPPICHREAHTDTHLQGPNGFQAVGVEVRAHLRLS